MDRFHRYIGKKLWFGLFNVGSFLYFILSGTLRFNLESILECILALFLMNCVALISARNFPDWK